MKNIRFTIYALLAAWCFSGSALAATSTASLNVSLAAIANVTVSATAIAFGNQTTGFPTSTGTITVNAPAALPYHVALDTGQNPQTAGALCHRMTPGTGATGNVDYNLYPDISHTVKWGDSDFANTCPSTATAGPSVAGTGSGANQVLTVYASAAVFSSALGNFSDVVTVTVHF